jgi:hypothetical protein
MKIREGSMNMETNTLRIARPTRPITNEHGTDRYDEEEREKGRKKETDEPMDGWMDGCFLPIECMMELTHDWFCSLVPRFRSIRNRERDRPMDGWMDEREEGRWMRNAGK